MKLADLITTIEQLTGASREVDAQICVALGLFVTRPNQGWPDRIDYGHLGPDGTITWPGHGFDQLVPRLTASLDAAIALCERVLPGWKKQVFESFEGLWIARVTSPRRETHSTDYMRDIPPGGSTNGAIALALAALRALHAQEERDG